MHEGTLTLQGAARWVPCLAWMNSGSVFLFCLLCRFYEPCDFSWQIRICLQRALRDVLQLVGGVVATRGRALGYRLQPSPLLPAGCCLRVTRDASFLCSALRWGGGCAPQCQSCAHLCEQGAPEPWGWRCWGAAGRLWLGLGRHPRFLPPAARRSSGAAGNPFVWSCSEIVFLEAAANRDALMYPTLAALSPSPHPEFCQPHLPLPVNTSRVSLFPRFPLSLCLVLRRLFPPC